MKPGLLTQWSAEYRRSIKAVETEELFDLYLYRPLAFLVTKALIRTTATPNQVSVASLACGLAAGYFFWLGTGTSAALGAAAFFACNVLDCADGQLARLRGVPSPFGYIVDGSIDYAASIAVFAGIAHGLAIGAGSDGIMYGMGARAWLLALVAGLSFGWQCAILDRTRIEWGYRVLGKRRDPDEERAFFIDHRERYRREGTHRFDRVLIHIYLAYHAAWDRLTPRAEQGSPGQVPSRDAAYGDREAWASCHRTVLRLALVMGPTTHMTCIMIAGLLDRTSSYLWGAIVLGNAWAILVQLAQRSAASRLRTSRASCEVTQ